MSGTTTSSPTRREWSRSRRAYGRVWNRRSLRRSCFRARSPAPVESRGEPAESERVPDHGAPIRAPSVVTSPETSMLDIARVTPLPPHIARTVRRTCVVAALAFLAGCREKAPAAAPTDSALAQDLAMAQRDVPPQTVFNDAPIGAAAPAKPAAPAKAPRPLPSRP